MEIEIFTACDNAQTYQDKLVIVGTFHNIASTEIPFTFDSMSIVCAIRFMPEELLKENNIEFQFNNDDGTKFITQQINANLAAHKPEEITPTSQILNLAINLRNIEFKRTGSYFIDLYVNNKFERRFPLEIMKS